MERRTQEERMENETKNLERMFIQSRARSHSQSYIREEITNEWDQRSFNFVAKIVCRPFPKGKFCFPKYLLKNNLLRNLHIVISKQNLNWQNIGEKSFRNHFSTLI